jgi:sporulation protein YlmC with PRC-barrel domain
MKTLAYTTAALAIAAMTGFAYAQDATAPAPAPNPAVTAPADCPAPGSVPEAQLPENCKTNMQQPAAGATDQNAAGTTAQQPAAGAADQSTTATTAPPTDMNPATSFLASNFIGQTVYSAANENVGEINDLIMDKDKGMVVAVVGVGGFLGIGEKDVAIGLDKINAAKTDNNAIRLTINATRQELEAAPAFDRNVLTMNSGTMGTTGTGAGTTAPAPGTTTSQ